MRKNRVAPLPAPASSQGPRDTEHELQRGDESYEPEDGRFLGTASCARLEDAMSSALNQAVYERAPRPIARVAELLKVAADHEADASPQAPPLVLPSADDEAGDAWSLAAWVRGAGVHRVVAAVLQRGMGDRDPLAVLKGLDGRGALAALLDAGALADGLAAMLGPEVEKLKRAGAATGKEIQSKFAGEVEMSYSGLDKFFGGLEGVVGAPDPNLFEAMEKEHTKSRDSNQEFITGNYSVKTTPSLEWAFVVSEEAARETRPTQPDRDSWPAEAEDKLPDRGKCRRKLPLAELKKKAVPINEKLKKAKQPELEAEELIAANGYTGPMYVKYNGVLRGLQSTSPFLRNTMVQLCCPVDIAKQYQGSAKIHETANGALTFEEAKTSLNKYTTTLHGINSAIIKLGKLTIATKVYRGYSGMALPKEFWEANEFGVRGGVENAFMSTTLQRSVAMGYAAGEDASRMGIVMEVQQGMVNRGALLDWLSQYPHECEILFGPLTGIEVLGTRIDGSVVVILAAFSINLTALTLEEVLGKRRKVVRDMCEQLAYRARLEAEGVAWAVLRRGANDRSSVPAAVEAFLQQRLMPLAEEEASHYNENAPLGAAIQEAVAMAEVLAGWPKELEELVQVALVGGQAATVEVLVRSEGPIALSLTEQTKVVPIGVMHGLCALLWARPKEAPIQLDLSKRKVGAEGMAALGRALTPTLASLNLEGSNCANNGGDLSGVWKLCAALGSGAAAGLMELNLTMNSVGPEGGAVFAEGLKGNTSLKELSIGYNKLTNDGKDMSGVLKIAEALPQTKLTRLNVGSNKLGVEGGKAFAAVLKDTQLTNLHVGHNDLGVEGGKVFAAVLKDTQLTNLNIESNGLGAEGGKTFAAVLKDTHLTILNIASNNLTNYGKDMSGVLKLAEALPQSKLTHLDVSVNRLGVEGVKAFAAVLKDTQITSLDIGSNYLTNDGNDMSGVLKLAEALPQSKLTTLNLSSNGLGQTGYVKTSEVQGPSFEIGAKVMYQGRELTVSQAPDNDGEIKMFDPTASLAIAASLPECKNLTSLNVCNNYLDAESGKAFADVLKDTQITTLDIRQNNLTNNGKDMSGVLKLAEALPQTKLESLDISNNNLAGETDYVNKSKVEGSSFEVGAKVTYEGREMTVSKAPDSDGDIKMMDLSGLAFIASLPECKSLTSLNVERNSLGVEGCKAFAAVLKDTQLTSLNLQYNSLNDAEKQAVQAAAGSSGVKLAL